MNVDSQPTNKDTKENKTEVRLAQTYKNYKVDVQDLIVKVDKNGVITTVSGKVVVPNQYLRNIFYLIVYLVRYRKLYFYRYFRFDE